MLDKTTQCVAFRHHRRPLSTAPFLRITDHGSPLQAQHLSGFLEFLSKLNRRYECANSGASHGSASRWCQTHRHEPTAMPAQASTLNLGAGLGKATPFGAVPEPQRDLQLFNALGRARWKTRTGSCVAEGVGILAVGLEHDKAGHWSAATGFAGFVHRPTDQACDRAGTCRCWCYPSTARWRPGGQTDLDLGIGGCGLVPISTWRLSMADSTMAFSWFWRQQHRPPRWGNFDTTAKR